MARDPVTAVLTGDLNMVRCFDDAGLRTMLVGSDPDDLKFHSRSGASRLIADPRTEPERAVDDLVALGKALPGRPALFYDSDPMLVLISRNRVVLERYFRFRMPDPELVEALASKVEFDGLARRLDLPVPKTVLSRDVSSGREAAAKLTLPCMFKPVSHAGWYTSDVVVEAGAKPFKALLAETYEQFLALWKKMSRFDRDFVVQEYVPGRDSCIYSFHAYLDDRSRPLGYFVGQKLRTYPKTSGVSTYLELTHDAEVERLGFEILSRMKFVGPVKLDFKKDEARGRFYLLEMNPRFNLWHHLGAACGINLPRIAYDDLFGTASAARFTEYRTGVRWLSFGNDARAFLRDYRPGGELTLAQWLWSLRGEKIHDVFSWRDPQPFGAWLMRYASTFARARLGSVR
ncbi:MAG: hypothetical protein ABIP89_22185 [Polyangiaceae bacterium]